jgi:hypothetical protein
MIKNLLIILFSCFFNTYCFAQHILDKEDSIPKEKKEINSLTGSERNLSISKSNSASIYPNPASGIAHVEYMLALNIREAKIIIYNILGNVVKEIELSKTSNKVEISVQNVNPGVYFYSLELDGVKQSTKRLVIK